MISVITRISKKIEEMSGHTAERPRFLETDSLARYSFALKYCKNRKVLDVGTGYGLGAKLIAENGAKEVEGIDYNKNVISEIKNKNKLKNLKFRFLNALDLGKIEERFDVILAFEVIEHIDTKNVRDFITIIYNLLSPGGTLLISTPNGINSEFIMGSLYNPYHVKEYLENELDSLLLRYFTKVEMKGYSMINTKYMKKDKEITTSFISKIVHLLGHFKVVREVLAFVPTSLKHVVTKENSLPTLTIGDYKLFNKAGKSFGLFAIAQKNMAKDYNPKVSVIVPNYNGENYIDKCLGGVLKSDYKNFEVLVGDDGSTDKSLDILKKYNKKNPAICVQKNNENLGAAATRNKLSKNATGDILVFLDNDAVIDKKCLSNLVKPFSENKTVGAVQALILDMENKSLIQHAGGILIPQVGWLLPFYQWKDYKLVKDNIKVNDIVSVSAALAVRKDVFNSVNGFDYLEAVHTEDIDLDWRIWISGYKTVLAKNALAYHFSKTVEKRSHMMSSNYKIYFHLAKNSFRSIIKNYETGNILKFLPQSLLVNISRGILVLVKRGDISALFATISAVFWNILHLSDTLKQRAVIQEHRILSDNYIMNNVFDSNGLLEIYNRNFKQTKLLW